MSESHELVITRRESETIVIGDPRNPIARVTVYSIKGEDRVRLGVRVQCDTPVHRGEIADNLDDDDSAGSVPVRA